MSHLTGKNGLGKREQSTFGHKLRSQFTFLSDDENLSCIIDKIVKEGINITAILQSKTNDGLNLVKLVVGTPNHELKSELLITRSIIQRYTQQHRMDQVIQVNGRSSTPSVLNKIYGALWCKVKVKAIYAGEETRIYLDVSDISETVVLLLAM